MKTAASIIAFLAPFSLAAPTSLTKRAVTDAQILNYALTLEHLEATFYAEGLKNFTEKQFCDAGFTETLFYKNLGEVARDEATHVSFLTSALQAAGATPVAACTYNFGNLTPRTFIQTASILEGVGVSAYLGAAASIANKDYLTAAGSILTVESRHDAFIRNSLPQSPFPQPFDIPLDFDEVYSLAAPFIVSCPSSNPALPVKAFPALTVETQQMPIPQGSTIRYEVAQGTMLPSGPLYIAFPLVTGPVFEPAQIDGDCIEAKIPTGANGPAGETYAILTTSNSSVTDDNVVAGPAVVQVYAPYLI
ncbi:hypothetical protein EV356DRAFT_447044 [Viridothelium virens]|uniref:Uncharacterized protein n=1 Tax=Viridothelium virens TaxID=1048519 RepID=A0A6A6H9T5_VIRVR|nr:hypothetical protein EV356DRAFT_447044 [Viridothelium virens]